MNWFVLMIGVAVATSSFDGIIQEILTFPDVPTDLTLELLTNELDARLTRLASGYQMAVHSGETQQRDQLNSLRRLRTSTERRMRRTYNEVTRTVQDMFALERMSRSTTEARFKSTKVKRMILDKAYHENVAGVEDALIVENMLGLIDVSNYWEDFVMPNPSDDLEETVRIFENSNKMLPTNAWMLERIENVEVVSIRYLTSLNMQYLHIKIRLLLSNRPELLTRLEAIRNDIANRLLGAADEGRRETDKINAQYAFEEFRFAANEVAERSIQWGFHSELPDSFFERKISEGIEDLDRLTHEASEVVEPQLLGPIRIDAEQRLVAGYESLRESIRAVGEVDDAALATLDNDVFRLVDADK